MTDAVILLGRTVSFFMQSTEGISPDRFGDASHTIYRIERMREKPGEIPSLFVRGVGVYEVMTGRDFFPPLLP